MSQLVDLGVDRHLLAVAVEHDDEAALEHWGSWRSEVDLDDHSQVAFQMLPDVFRRLEVVAPDDPELARLRGAYRKSWVQHQLEVSRLLPTLTALASAGIDHMVPLGRMVTVHTGLPRIDVEPRVTVRWADIAAAVTVIDEAGWARLQPSLKSLRQLSTVRRRVTSAELGFSRPVEGSMPEVEWVSLGDHLVPGRAGQCVSERIWSAAEPINAGSAHCAARADVAFAVAAQPGPTQSTGIALDLAALARTAPDRPLTISIGEDPTREIDRRVEDRLAWFESLGGALVERVPVDDTTPPAENIRERTRRWSAQQRRHGGTVPLIRSALGR